MSRKLIPANPAAAPLLKSDININFVLIKNEKLLAVAPAVVLAASYLAKLRQTLVKTHYQNESFFCQKHFFLEFQSLSKRVPTHVRLNWKYISFIKVLLQRMRMLC